MTSQRSHICCTAFGYLDDKYKVFTSVYNQVFPIDLEEIYVVLSNLVSDYINTSRSIGASNDESFYIVSDFPDIYESLENLGDLDTINGQIRDIGNNLQNDLQVESYDKLIKLVSSARKMLEKKLSLESKLKSGIGSYYQEERKIHIQRKNLERIVFEMASVLSILENNVRIDGLQIVPERHFGLIDAMDISDKEKTKLKSQLVSYFNMRVGAFKLIKAFATKIVSLYHKREVIDNASELELCRFVLLVLDWISEYEIQHLNTKKLDLITEFMTNSIFNEAEFVDALSVYLNMKKSNSMDVNEVFEETFDTNINYLLRTLYMNVLDGNMAIPSDLLDMELKK